MAAKFSFSYVFRRHSKEKWYRISTRISNIQYPPLGVEPISRDIGFSPLGVDIEDIEVASLEWGQAPKPPSFVALRATTQSTRWSTRTGFRRPIVRCFVHLTRSLVHLTGRVDALLLLAAHSTHATPYSACEKVNISSDASQPVLEFFIKVLLTAVMQQPLKSD